ncbi:hypothetical protein JR316_0008981 [Psilocybe cubensis]|uniref:Uncharacterized protein n=2 Tax=Psilocybe cubensis TaxID=181762 RepID=A0A8H7XZ82_PSICU|nr:hypothetical protein JR316_0008981 [Psilocybe cubensis]KAH9478526.1 hypothetical protein JR316_0008981 [Psilocybe cubensis]
MHFRYLSICLWVSAITCTNATPSPSNEPDYPEVIPGPGLPSLESLGLTSADLHRNRTMSKAFSDSAEFLVVCIAGGSTVSVGNAQACVNYLANLGTTDCGVPANPGVISFCVSGDASICGTNIWGNGQEVHSWCSDVAISAQAIVNGCQVTSGQVEGYAPAAQNSNLQVDVEPLEIC